MNQSSGTVDDDTQAAAIRARHQYRQLGQTPSSAQPCEHTHIESPLSSTLLNHYMPSSSPDSVQFLQAQLDAWIQALPPTMVGALGGNGGELKMPLTSRDGRALSWKKWASEIIAKVTNSPTTTDDCWFIAGFAGDTSGYPLKRIAAGGNRNKWAVHRMTYFLMNPNQIHLAPTNQHCSHRCNRGRYDKLKGIDVACINPHHLILCPPAENQDHKGCIRSQAAWCPHTPRCIFTNSDGLFLPCRNTIKRMPMYVCSDGRDCLEDEKYDKLVTL